MYDFAQAVPGNLITKEIIFSKVTQQQIFFYYFGPFERGKIYPSRLRKDVNPSVGFIVSANGTLYHNDIAKGEMLDCFGYVQRLLGLSFKEALYKVAADFGILEGYRSVVPQRLIDAANREAKLEKIAKLIQFIPDQWDERNLKFWKEYHITKEELVKENIFPVKRLFLNKQEIVNKGGLPKYAYYRRYKCEFDKTMKEGLKIYSPYDIRERKWLSSIPNNVPFGTKSLDLTLDHVIVTKSRKDEIVLKKIINNVISLQNESHQAFTDVLQQYLLTNFKKAIVIFDADATGVKVCTELNKKGFLYFNTPKEDFTLYGVKDPSDFVKRYGVEALDQLFNSKKLLL